MIIVYSVIDDVYICGLKSLLKSLNCNINVIFIYTCNDNDNGDNNDIINRNLL